MAAGKTAEGIHRKVDLVSPVTVWKLFEILRESEKQIQTVTEFRQVKTVNVTEFSPLNSVQESQDPAHSVVHRSKQKKIKIDLSFIN